MAHHIYVLEDSTPQRKKIVNIIQTHIDTQGYPMVITQSTYNPKKILAKVNPANRNIYFFDIDLGEAHINGIETAIQLREIDPAGIIAFISTHSDMAVLTFKHKLNVQDFIIKDDPEEIAPRIQEVLDTAHQTTLPPPDTELFKLTTTIGTVENVPLANILFFETHHTPHKLVLHTINSRVEFYGTLDKIEEHSPSFYRAHRANLINIQNIKTIHKASKTVEMINGATTFIAARRIKKLVDMVTH